MEKKSKKSIYWTEFENRIKEAVEDKVKTSVELLHYDYDCDKDVKVAMCKFDIKYVVAYINEYGAVDGIYILGDRRKAFEIYLDWCSGIY